MNHCYTLETYTIVYQLYLNKNKCKLNFSKVIWLHPKKYLILPVGLDKNLLQWNWIRYIKVVNSLLLIQLMLCSQMNVCIKLMIKKFGGVGGTSLVVQWVKLCAPKCRGLGSIPGRGARSHIPQLRNAHAATKEILGSSAVEINIINKNLCFLNFWNCGLQTVGLYVCQRLFVCMPGADSEMEIRLQATG